jgi:hypothetical protein
LQPVFSDNFLADFFGVARLYGDAGVDEMFLIRVKELISSGSGLVAPDRMDAPRWSFPESGVVFPRVHGTIVALSLTFA